MSTALTKAARLKPEIRLAQAVSEFQRDLSSEQKAMFTNVQTQATQRPPGIKDVMQLTAALDRRNKDKVRCFGPRFTNFLEGVQQFAALGDVIVGGSQQIIACGVWSLVRLSLMMAVGFTAYFEKLSVLFMEIGSSAPRFQSISALYPRMKHLQDHLNEYFIEIVQLCHEVLHSSNRGILGQLASSLNESRLKNHKAGLNRWAAMIRDDVSGSMAKSIEEERDQNSGFREKLLKMTSRQTAFNNQWERIRILDACSTYDHQSTWKQSRKAGTTKSFLALPGYQAWRASPASSTLRYTGILGSGKTVLLANMVDDLNLSTESTNAPVVYFFCRHDIHDSLQSRTVIGSLARQILSATDIKVDEPSQDDQHQSLGADDILTLLKRSFPSDLSVFCVIDGLDECDPESRRDIADFLVQLQGSINCRVCYSTRLQVDAGSHDMYTRFVDSHTIEIPSDNSEIDDFIKSELERRLESGALSLGDPTLVMDILCALKKGSQGMFLWAALQIQVISTMATDDAIRASLTDLPRDLSETFARIQLLYQGSRADYQKRMLELVYAARQPLTTEELREALSVTPRDTVWCHAKVLNDISPIIACCGPLITLDEEDGTVRFVHFSVKQYLEADAGCSVTTSFADQAQETAAEIVFTYLCYDIFDGQLVKTKTPDKVFQSVPSSIITSVFTSTGMRRELAIKLLKGGRSTTTDVARVIEEHSRTSRTTDSFQFRRCAETFWESHLQHVSDTKWLVSRLRQLSKRKTGFGPGSISEVDSAGPRTYDGKPMLDVLFDEHGNRQAMFLQAVDCGDEVVVRLLLETRLDTETEAGSLEVDWNRSWNCRTPLLIAAERGYEAIVKLLLAQNGIDVNARDQWFRTPLFWAAESGHEAIVKLLLAHNGVDVVARDQRDRTPLLYAAESGHEAIVKLLLAQGGVHPDAKARNGQTTLSQAAEYGYEAVVRLLLEQYGVDVNVGDEYGRTPLFLAAQSGHDAVVRLLLAQDGVDPDAKAVDGQTPLSQAAEYGHEAVVRLLLEQYGVNVDARDTVYSRSALSWAALHGWEAIVRLLLARPDVEVDLEDKRGRTPLIHAACKGNQGIVCALLETGKDDLNTIRSDGDTALTRAAQDGLEADVRALLKTGKVDVNVACADGETALSLGAQEGHNADVRALLKTGKVDVNVARADGKTALILAALRGHEGVVRALLETGNADVNAGASGEGPPLILAANKGHEGIIRALLEIGKADVNVKGHDGSTALMSAVERGHQGVVRAVLETENVDVNACIDGGFTALMLAASKGHDGIATDLLRIKSIQVDAANDQGRTALFYAVDKGHLVTVKNLLQTGEADACREDKAGDTPLKRATWYRNTVTRKKMLRLLQAPE